MQKVYWPKVCWSKCQDAAIRPCRPRAISPLAIESRAPLREICIGADIEVPEHPMAKQLEKPKRLGWAVARKAYSGVVFDVAIGVLFGESSLPPAPLKPRVGRLFVPERHRVIPAGDGVPQRQFHALPYRTSVGSLHSLFIAELMRVRQAIGLYEGDRL